MQKPINVHLSNRYSNFVQSSNIQKSFNIFSNMKNITQNIQNGSFDKTKNCIVRMRTDQELYSKDENRPRIV